MAEIDFVDGEIVRIIPLSPYRGFHKGFTKKLFVIHIAKILMG